eukprot:scaffold6889_cov390-Prasinococcus_capsulatus_cf.AAC.1
MYGRGGRVSYVIVADVVGLISARERWFRSAPALTNCIFVPARLILCVKYPATRTCLAPGAMVLPPSPPPRDHSRSHGFSAITRGGPPVAARRI